MFQAVYYVVKGFLDPVTRAKLHFLNDVDDSAMQVGHRQISVLMRSYNLTCSPKI